MSASEYDALMDLINQIQTPVSKVDSDTANDKEISLEKQITMDREDNYRVCPCCDIQCKIDGAFLICESCGMKRDWITYGTDNCYNSSIEDNYNTSNKSFLAFKPVGPNSHGLYKSMLITCSDQGKYRCATNKKKITNLMYRYEGHIIPMNVVNHASSLYEEVLNKGYMFRSRKKGLFAACLYYSCIEYKLSRPPKEIANIMEVSEEALSHGDRFLQELNELGIISIKTDHEPIGDYLNQYFSALGIDKKYKQFVLDIIKRAEAKYLHIKNESRTTSKCVGAIYLLTIRVPELRHISKETISKECNDITTSTFIRYCKLLMEHHVLLKKVFKRHRIPMPVEWRN